MGEGHQNILNFLQALRKTKGSHGKIRMSAVQWDHYQNAEKTKISNSFCQRNSSFKNDSIPTAANNILEQRKNVSSCNWDGKLRVGAYVSFKVTSPITGFVHAFNLGTSGTCSKLVPYGKGADNSVKANEEFVLPSKALLGKGVAATEVFPVLWDARKENIQPDRLLIIATTEDIPINVEDLDPRLSVRERNINNRGAGFGAQIEKSISNLFLIASDWEYGLLEMAIKHE